jgi:SagB-type dehydrogenase family enzyme
MIWRQFHELTKHTAEALRRTQHVLDWENMPDPFRHYDGVPVLDLPADPPTPEIPALELLQGGYGRPLANDGPSFLSQLLFHSFAISASKLVPSTGYRYALRVNPSSGNLHPTEVHFLTRGLRQWPDGLYHYRPSSHMAEQRATGDVGVKFGFAPSSPIVFILTSIAWREAWKYRDRAYRYCLHDIGHAWQSLALAAQAVGCESYVKGVFPDDEVAQSCRLHEDEWPMLLIEIRGNIPIGDAEGASPEWIGGRANSLSSHQIAYPMIDRIHAATKLISSECRSTPAAEHPVASLSVLPSPVVSQLPFGEVVRTRRSALDFRGGAESMSFAQLCALLQAAAQPLSADFADGRFIQLYLYAHRVENLEPSVYRYWPSGNGLQQIRSGDQRVAAAGLSLGQDLAGNACVAFSMIADLDLAARTYGDRGYRYAHFEAGAVGQRLYLAAESLGLGATGIGAFFDDEVHRYLGITPETGQVIYHFAVGYPVFDPRVNA